MIYHSTRSKHHGGTVTFPETLRLDPDRKYFISMKECQIPYRWHNISAKFKNNSVPYITDEAHQITIDNGNHDCDSLNYRIVKYFKMSKEDIPIFFAEPPGITNRVSITLKKGWKVDFRNTDLRKLLGFKGEIYGSDEENTEVIGDFSANVERDVRTIFIHCCLVEDSYSDDNGIMMENDLLYTFVPNKEPNSWLVVSPNPIKKFAIDMKRLWDFL